MRPDLSSFSGRRYDIAVIGAGINGAASAARLARRGYKVLLVDKGDFGSGSSGRSSRLLHCGLNALASTKEAVGLAEKLKHFAAARQMLGFRSDAARQFPDKIGRRQFYIPVFTHDRIPPWQFRMAFALLSTLSGFKDKLGFTVHRPTDDAAPVLKHFGEALDYAVSFSDVVYDWPERLCIDQALDAERSGADIRNYTEFARAHADGESGWRIDLTDALDRTMSVTVGARLLLNLTGVWSDGVNARLRNEGGPTVTPNKGCHIAVTLPKDFSGKGIICRNAIGHLFICVPWRGFHIIGPTETAYSGPLDGVSPTEEDVALLLNQANATIPGLHLTAEDVIFRWAGLRPAAFEAGNPRGAWDRRFHDLSPGPDAPAIGLSWGRIADHPDTAATIVGMVERRLGPSKGAVPSGVEYRGAGGTLDDIIRLEQPMTVADVLFRRTGEGWNRDLGVPKAEAIAEALLRHGVSGTVTGLVEDYRAYLHTILGYSAAK